MVGITYFLAHMQAMNHKQAEGYLQRAFKDRLQVCCALHMMTVISSLLSELIGCQQMMCGSCILSTRQGLYAQRGLRTSDRQAGFDTVQLEHKPKQTKHMLLLALCEENSEVYLRFPVAARVLFSLEYSTMEQHYSQIASRTACRVYCLNPTCNSFIM